MRRSRTYAASSPRVRLAVGTHRDVVDDADAVTEPLAPAERDGLVDRRQPESLAGVDGDVARLAAQVLERVEVARGREPGLGAGDVEADDTAVAVRDDELGDLARARGGAHRGQQRPHRDAVAGVRSNPLALREALEHGVDHLGQCEPAGDVQLGCEAHLGVHDPVGREVLRALRGHAHERRSGLHDADRVREGLEIALEGARVGRLDEPAAERDRIGGGQAVVAGLVGELDDRGRTQSTVEVVVQEGLGRPTNQVLREGRAASGVRVSRGCCMDRSGLDAHACHRSGIRQTTAPGTSTRRGVRPMRCVWTR